MLPSASSSLQNGVAQNGEALPSRYALAKAILGEEAFRRINTAKILVVGAGGIGCELLKNLALTGFGNIEIIDLDTIDLSNLNRQFLFQKQHIKKPKSIVAKQTASAFNPLVNIVAHHANIKEPRFGVAYFQRFDLVMNALDNLDARRWVNKMCIAADVPLIESGTTGFRGQVQPIKRGVTECYDCTTKPPPKSFPVCTIRSTPSTPIHCIVWAKSWLFTQLFGQDDETEEAELDKAIADGEDAQEINSLRKEAREMRDIRAALIRAAKDGDAEAVRAVAEQLFNKVYKNDIQRLLSMEKMWEHRPVKPVPLEFQDALSGAASAATQSAENPAPTADAVPSSEAATASETNNASQLKDQRTLSLKDNVELFLSSVSALATRAAADLSNPLSFDKDDDDALDFVTASSNLRSIVYHIETKTRFQVKQMAGNIIPAIATTNAIIAGAQVLQALHALRGRWNAVRIVTLTRGSDRYIASVPPFEPNPSCGVCQDVYVPVEVASLEQVTLEQVVETVARQTLQMDDEDLVVYDGSRILADPDFDDNWHKSLAQMGLHTGSILTVMDEDQKLQAVNMVLSVAHGGEPVKILTTQVSKPKRRFVPPQSPNDDQDDDDELTIVEAPDVTPAPNVVSGAGKKRPHPDEVSSISTPTPEKKQKTLTTPVMDGSSQTAAIHLD